MDNPGAPATFSALVNRNSLQTALTGVLALIVLLLCWMTISYNLALRKYRNELQPKAANYNQNNIRMQAVARDVLEYSKRNPAIDPILRSVGLKESAAPAPKATGK